MQINVELINPFIGATQKVLKETCQIEAKVGKPYLKDKNFKGDVVAVLLGVTGMLRGQIIFSFGNESAKNIASKMMMGMPVEELDDMSKSALSELCNMISGNAATSLSQRDLILDITPPTLTTGANMAFDTGKEKILTIPILFEKGGLEIDIVLRKVER